MNVRCKFVCKEKTEKRGYVSGKSSEEPLYGYKFYPVMSGSEENKKFYSATPIGHLEFDCVTSGLFEVGKEYYLDISPSE
jgi:hypothetical protein